MGCPTWSADQCHDVNSDWYQWVTDERIVNTSGLYVSGEPVDHGPGMWETFEDDVDLMAADGHNAYRMSIEWSRLFPDAATEGATTVDELDDIVDVDARARYHAMLDAQIAVGIAPLVTVNHYTLPLWVHDGVACHDDPEACEASGWLDGDRMIPLITLYAGWLAREYGSKVDQWATLNEPFATTLSGYVQPGEERSAPPGLVFHGEGAVASASHQIEASASMYDAVHEWDRTDADGDGEAASVGIVINMVAITPKTDSEADLEAVEHMDYVYHRFFLDGLTDGSWDEDLDGTPDRTREELANRLDWIGVNYYNQVFVTGWGLVPVPEVPIFDFFPEVTWDLYPEGIAQVVGVAGEYGLPIYVTENGTNITEKGRTALEGHLTELQAAIADGADVRGYFYWTFVDNYEWNHGMTWKMGLYELDPDTKARTRREVGTWYAGVIEANALPE